MRRSNALQSKWRFLHMFWCVCVFPEFRFHLVCILICVLFNNEAVYMCLPRSAVVPQAFDMGCTSDRFETAISACTTKGGNVLLQCICQWTCNNIAVICVSILVSMHQLIVEGKDADPCGKGICSRKSNSLRPDEGTCGMLKQAVFVSTCVCVLIVLLTLVCCRI